MLLLNLKKDLWVHGWNGRGLRNTTTKERCNSIKNNKDELWTWICSFIIGLLTFCRHVTDEIRCWSWNPGLDCCGFNLFFLGARITDRMFGASRIIIMCHHKLNLCIVCCFSFLSWVHAWSPKCFLVSFSSPIVREGRLTPKQQEWKFPSQRSVLWRHAQPTTFYPVRDVDAANITLSRDFRLKSGADLVASWIISVTDDVNKKRGKGPRVNKDKCNYISTARTNAQNGCIWVFGRCTARAGW